MRKIILTLILITAISGCAMPDVFQGLIPGFEDQEVKELPPDILSIHSLTVIPTPPLNADDTFSVSFVIANQDDVNPVEDVTYTLFDHGLCEPNRAIIIPDDIYSLGEFAPLQEEFIEWDFTAPDNSDIANIGTTCPIRFKADYNFDSKSQIDVHVISQDRLTELHRTGGVTTSTPTLTVGRGPVKVYLSFGASFPVKADNTLPVYLIVEDKGNGLYSEVGGGSLSIDLPNGLCVDSYDTRKFTISGTCNNGEQTITLRDNTTVPLIRKKTSQMRFVLKTPDVSVEKTIYITANLNYDYSITGEAQVEIKPTG